MIPYTQTVPHAHGGYAGFLPRPTATSGLLGWLTTVDHKRIGILYGASAILFFFVGGLEALMMRTQLAVPNARLVGADMFNQLLTMHGTTMIFLVVMPMGAAWFNFMVPLMIGARDVAFPRLNAFSYWMFLAGGILLNSSWILGGATNAGWFGYANLTSRQFNPGLGVDFWVLSLQILGIASLVAALNFLVTIINMRCPGMSMMRMPVFVWMTLVTSVLLLLAFPVITIALAELMFDRMFSTNFFNPAKGGLPILWQHLFWVFGHPEVYILILPAMGIVSEILPVFSRKPLFGYPVVVFSGAAIGFMGFTVWSHHMFTTGMGWIANTAFALTTMAIAVPTGVKIFNWVGTLWGGQIRFTTPLLYALGFISMFMIGGFSGLTHASPPGDAQQQDTYYIVAHFHYVLIGGSLMALIGGLYYWWPKVTGRLANETIGKIGFVLIFIGFNVTFFPMHWLGLIGMPRRIYTYDDGMGFNEINMLCTVGAYIMLVAFLVMIYNFVTSLKHGQPAGNDPWDARTLEWTIPSPPPVYNFEKIPVVTDRDALWMQKYPHLLHHGEEGHEEPHAGGHGGHDEPGHGIHMPGQSWYPFMAGLGFLVGAYGLIYWGSAGYPVLPVALLGLFFGIYNVYNWALEGIGGYEIHLAEDSNHE